MFFNQSTYIEALTGLSGDYSATNSTSCHQVPLVFRPSHSVIPFKHNESEICQLQKMYVSTDATVFFRSSITLSYFKKKPVSRQTLTAGSYLGVSLSHAESGTINTALINPG